MSDGRKTRNITGNFPTSPILELAGTQGGHVNRAQLRALGLPESRIDYLVRSRWLLPVHHNVYAVGRRSTNPLDLCHAALLAIGERCALAGWSAAALWGVRGEWRFPLEVITPLDHRVGGLIVHRSGLLTRGDITVQHGLTVVAPALAVLQIAPDLTKKQLERTIDDLRLNRYLKLADLAAIPPRFPRHPGAARLRQVLRIAHEEPTRSPWEQDWRPFAARLGLPAHAMNVELREHLGRPEIPHARPDVLFLPARLIVQLDGWETHGTPWAFEEDRESDLEVFAELDIATVRVTRRQLRARPERQAERILKILQRR